MCTSFGLLFACGLLAATSNLRAEEVTVFACETHLAKIPRPAVISKFDTKDRAHTLRTYKLGPNVGTLNTGNADLAAISRKALAEDQSQSPLLESGYQFILRDTKGQHYLAYLEYEKGHPTFDGFRAALAPIADLGSKGTVFVGDPNQGVTFDKELLKQLKVFADQLADKPETDSKKVKSK